MTTGISDMRALDLVERAPIGIYRSTGTGRFLYVNAALTRMLGYDIPRQVLALEIENQIYYDPADRLRVFELFEKQGEVVGYEVRLVRRDGSPLWARLDMRRAEGDSPGSFQFEGFVHDISKSRQAEEELRKLSRAVEHSPASVVITDLKGDIEYVNPKFTAITGYTREEVVGRNPRILKSGESPPETYAALWDAIMHGREWHGELHNKRKDGTLFWESASISPVIDAQGVTTHFVGVKEDITARKEAEAQLRQSQKMEAVGRLAGGIAHDFNNLLTAILGFTELLLADVGPSDPHRAELEEILAAGQRAAALTRQLLTFGRKQVEQVELVDVGEVIRGTEQMLRRLIGEDVAFQTSVPDDLGEVRGDHSQIEQVLVNLVVNARDALPNGGTIRIEAANVTRADAEPGSGHRSADHSWVVLTVADDGVGMSAETLRHVFEPFFTTKPKGKGSGLGLATVYAIVNQSGGFTEVSSAPEKGTTFRIFLPRAAEVPAIHSRSAVNHRPFAGGTETILLAEDEDLVRKLAADVLRRYGYTMLAAASGDEALALAEKYANAIRLVVTDVVMPGMSGPDLARRLVERGQKFPVLYISGYAGSPEGSGLLPEGAALLQKPFAPDALARRVREVLDGAAR